MQETTAQADATHADATQELIGRAVQMHADGNEADMSDSMRGAKRAGSQPLSVVLVGSLTQTQEELHLRLNGARLELVRTVMSRLPEEVRIDRGEIFMFTAVRGAHQRLQEPARLVERLVILSSGCPFCSVPIMAHLGIV